jgi:ribosomal protein L37E
MIFKYCNARVLDVVSEASTGSVVDSFRRRFASRYELDLKKNIYIRNSSVHSDELHGPNDNGDSFPRFELQNQYHTFINKRSTFDHRDDMKIGSIVDSVYFPPVKTAAIETLNGDERGDYVSNFIAIDKRIAEEFMPGSVQRIITEEINDTSMGAVVAHTTCSVCGHKAFQEDQYCAHVAGGKNREIVVAGSDKPKRVYEICHDVTFFEDSIIVPANLGGTAGGRGADRDAKMKDVITASMEEQLMSFASKLNPSMKNDFEQLLMSIQEELKTK